MIEEKIVETFSRKTNNNLSGWYKSKVIEITSLLIQQASIEEAPEDREIKQPEKQLELEMTLK